MLLSFSEHLRGGGPSLSPIHSCGTICSGSSTGVCEKGGDIFPRLLAQSYHTLMTDKSGTCPYTGNPYDYAKAALLGDRWEPISEEECEASLAQKHRRISLITADAVEAAANATLDYAHMDRAAFRQRMACLSKAMWVHSVAERLRKGKTVNAAHLQAFWQTLTAPDPATPDIATRNPAAPDVTEMGIVNSVVTVTDYGDTNLADHDAATLPPDGGDAPSARSAGQILPSVQRPTDAVASVDRLSRLAAFENALVTLCKAQRAVLASPPKRRPP